MYDYLVVGSGLYGAIFAHEAKRLGKTVLVVTNGLILQEMSIQKKLRESMCINTVRIFSIHLIRKSGNMLISLRNLTTISTHR